MLLPMAHADPDDTSMPLVSKSTSNASALMPGNTNDAWPGSREFGSPVRRAKGTACNTALMSSSRDDSNAGIMVGMRLHASCKATARPTAPATLGVPDLNPPSWPPPLMSGSIPTRLLLQRIPSPLGAPNLCPDAVRVSASRSWKSTGIVPAACTASTCTGTPASWQIRTASFTGSIVPTSLFAIMTQTSVAPLCTSSCSASRSMRAWASTGMRTTSNPKKSCNHWADSATAGCSTAEMSMRLEHESTDVSP